MPWEIALRSHGWMIILLQGKCLTRVVCKMKIIQVKLNATKTVAKFHYRTEFWGVKISSKIKLQKEKHFTEINLFILLYILVQRQQGKR